MTPKGIEAARTADGANGVKYETPKDHATLDRDDFMKLFVTQLQYQDPMKPMESAEMASQVAQFNMVDLMYKSNEVMERLAAADEARTGMSAVNLIGRKVQYEGSNILLDETGVEPFGITLEKPVVSSEIVIRDNTGKRVKTLDAGAFEKGRHTIQWDGRDDSGNALAEGTYSFTVSAMDQDGNEVEAKSWTTGLVKGVARSEKGLPEIEIKDGPSIKLDDVWKVG